MHPTVAPRQSHGEQMTVLDAQHREVEVVLDRQAEKQPRGLKGARQSGPRSPPRRLVRHLAAEELHGALGGRELAGDEVEERRLAGPVRAENGATFARPHLQVDLGHGAQAAETPADPPQAEDRLGALGVRLGYGHAGVLSRTNPVRRGFIDQPVKVTGTVCPTHGGGVFLVHSGCVRSGAGVVGLKKPPNAWSTFGTRSMVLMPGTWLPAGGGVICTTQLSKIAWRLESRLILP